jgi:peptidoglycan/xylan/chitin deacetylase (PgdA/CDA1 family)
MRRAPLAGPWAPAPSSRAAVPVLRYRGVEPREFARQMLLIDHAGYETITFDEFVRYVKRKKVTLPPRPLLLTFDGGRLDSWTGSDAILRRLGFNAVIFVNVGRVEEGDRDYLTWRSSTACRAAAGVMCSCNPGSAAS